ncbi:MAG: NnrS family protein, partial [Sphingomonadales bacterium]|nr:NnrS family protein [Sphingomonadales bacterium]
PVSLGLRAAAQFDGPAEVYGFHALALGAIGGLTLAMMARSARGHTGRPLRAGRAEIAAFALIQTAALARVVLPQLSSDLWTPAIALAAASWSVAFLLFFGRFLPILTQPRFDGRPG